MTKWSLILISIVILGFLLISFIDKEFNTSLMLILGAFVFINIMQYARFKKSFLSIDDHKIKYKLPYQEEKEFKLSDVHTVEFENKAVVINPNKNSARRIPLRGVSYAEIQEIKDLLRRIKN